MIIIIGQRAKRDSIVVCYVSRVYLRHDGVALGTEDPSILASIRAVARFDRFAPVCVRFVPITVIGSGRAERISVLRCGVEPSPAAVSRRVGDEDGQHSHVAARDGR